MTDVNNMEDIIDSRDVLERIADLTAEQEEAEESGPEAYEEWQESDEAEELVALQELASEAEGYAEDWQHGEQLIRDSYFVNFAQELADDIGATDGNASWCQRQHKTDPFLSELGKIKLTPLPVG